MERTWAYSTPMREIARFTFTSLDEAFGLKVENLIENNRSTVDGICKIIRRGSLRKSIAMTARMKILEVDDSSFNPKGHHEGIDKFRP